MPNILKYKFAIYLILWNEFIIFFIQFLDLTSLILPFSSYLQMKLKTIEIILKNDRLAFQRQHIHYFE